MPLSQRTTFAFLGKETSEFGGCLVVLIKIVAFGMNITDTPSALSGCSSPPVKRATRLLSPPRNTVNGVGGHCGTLIGRDVESETKAVSRAFGREGDCVDVLSAQAEAGSARGDYRRVISRWRR